MDPVYVGLTCRADVPTGEGDLRNKASETAKMIRNYLAHATDVDGGLVIFSNKRTEQAFQDAGFDKAHTGHFNNIKGLNTYSNAVNIAQVGLNRKPPIEYLTLDLARNSDVRSQLITDTASEGYIAAMSKARELLNEKTADLRLVARMTPNLHI